MESLEKYLNTDFYSKSHFKSSYTSQINTFLDESEPGELEIEDDRRMVYLLMKYSHKHK